MSSRVKQIQQLKNDGLTLAEIGLKFGISKQRVEQILKPERYRAYQKAYQRAYSKTPKRRAYRRAYERAYSKTPKRRAYQKHYYHLKVKRKFKNCEKCDI